MRARPGGGGAVGGVCAERVRRGAAGAGADLASHGHGGVPVRVDVGASELGQELRGGGMSLELFLHMSARALASLRGGALRQFVARACGGDGQRGRGVRDFGARAASTSFDWKERKKGAYTSRGAAASGPIVMCAAGRPRHHNAHDYKLMEIAAHVVFDVLFSKMRREMYVNERRAKKRALESRVTQYAKQQKQRASLSLCRTSIPLPLRAGCFRATRTAPSSARWTRA